MYRLTNAEYHTGVREILKDQLFSWQFPEKIKIGRDK